MSTDIITTDATTDNYQKLYDKTRDLIERNNYVIVSDLVDPQWCKELASRFNELAEQGKLTHDHQCPKSEAVYGAFDDVLERLHPVMESLTGKTLHPTYSYARRYAYGEVLENHKDRPACEYSATLLLDYRDCNWEIGFQNDYELNPRWYTLDIGSAAIYKGCEISHFREPYKGNYLVQVFLHYVDANGPHAEEKFDRRPSLGVEKTVDVVVEQDPQQEVIPCWVFEGVICPEQCDALIEMARNSANKIPGMVGGNVVGVQDDNIRKVQKVMLPTWQGIGAQLVGAAMSANHQAWQFDVTHAAQCEHLYYSDTGHYVAHVDAFIGRPSTDCRKLTALAFLNDDFEGGRFYFQDGHEKTYPLQTKGTVVVFPSFMLHGVEPVISGERHTVVCWILGPTFK